MAALWIRLTAVLGQPSPVRRIGGPRPEHDAAARLLIIAAGMAPLLGEPGQALVPPDALAELVVAGLGSRPAPDRPVQH